MLWEMSTNDLVVSFAFISCLSYMTGWFSDRILNSTGFGHIGNWLIILFGIYAGVYLYNYYGHDLSYNPTYTLAVFVGSAFVSLVFMCLVKRFTFS